MFCTIQELQRSDGYGKWHVGKHFGPDRYIFTSNTGGSELKN